MLLCEKISKGLPRTIFTNVLCFDSVVSTNLEAFEQAARHPSEQIVVLADAQTGGKGRHGRRWFSPPGTNIYMSLILRPCIEISEASLLTIMSATAVCEALRETSGADIRVKWPNDIVLGGKKLGGILIETRAENSLLTIAVIGIGLNVALSRDSFPKELRDGATSLYAETGRSFCREDIVLSILERISTLCRGLFVPSANSPERRVAVHEKTRIIDLWKSMDTVLGKNITVRTSQGTLAGKAIDIDSSGMLDLLTIDGEMKKIHTGDIEFS